MIVKNKTQIIIWISVMLFTSCYYDNEEKLYGLVDCSKVPATYTKDVGPIIVASCAYSGCHAIGGSLPELNTMAKVQSNAALVKKDVLSGKMPLTGSLSKQQIQTIQCWVDSGAPAN
jgi:hypothetical protein